MTLHSTASKMYQSLSGDNPNRTMRKDIAGLLAARLDAESGKHRAAHEPSDDLKQQLVDAIEKGRYMFWAGAVDQRVLSSERYPTGAWAYATLNAAYFDEHAKRVALEEAGGPLCVGLLEDHHRRQRHTLYAMAAIGQELEKWASTSPMDGSRSASELLDGESTLQRGLTPHGYTLARTIQHLGEVCRVLKADVPHAPDTETLRHSFDPGRLSITVQQQSLTQASFSAEYEGRPLFDRATDALLTLLQMSPTKCTERCVVSVLPDLLTHVGFIREQYVSALSQRDDALDILQQLANETLALIAARDHELNRPTTAADVLRETAISLLTRIDAQYDAVQVPWTQCTVDGRHGVIGAVSHVYRGRDAVNQAITHREELESRGYVDLKIACDVERQPLEHLSHLFFNARPDAYLSGYAAQDRRGFAAEEVDPLAPEGKVKNLLDWSDI
ncbi:hypothetical protein [Marinobacterium sp. BA1]|uniref:hypothetical protein n=1 Tax=Marinobacterium sp. BA1 TaxID=3138931 RepID=UPI0032E7ACD4